MVEPPIWKICSSQWESSPIFGVKMKHIWNHHLVFNDLYMNFLRFATLGCVQQDPRMFSKWSGCTVKESPNKQIPTSWMVFGNENMSTKTEKYCLYIPGGAGFLPSTLCRDPIRIFHPKFIKTQPSCPTVFLEGWKALPSLKLTAKAAENGWLEDYFYLLSAWVSAHFQERFAVSFGEWSWFFLVNGR